MKVGHLGELFFLSCSCNVPLLLHPTIMFRVPLADVYGRRPHTYEICRTVCLSRYDCRSRRNSQSRRNDKSGVRMTIIPERWWTRRRAKYIFGYFSATSTTTPSKLSRFASHRCQHISPTVCPCVRRKDISLLICHSPLTGSSMVGSFGSAVMFLSEQGSSGERGGCRTIYLLFFLRTDVATPVTRAMCFSGR